MSMKSYWMHAGDVPEPIEMRDMMLEAEPRFF